MGLGITVAKEINQHLTSPVPFVTYLYFIVLRKRDFAQFPVGDRQAEPNFLLRNALKLKECAMKFLLIL